MNPELVLNEEQKNQRFRSSFNLRCESVNTDYGRSETTSAENLLEGTEESISRTDNSSAGLSFINVETPAPQPPEDLFQSLSYEDIAVEPPEEATELKTEPFVRVSVIQKTPLTPSHVQALAEPLCLPDRNVLLQNEIDLVWHYIHKKFRRKKEADLILRFECNVCNKMCYLSSWLFREPSLAILSRFDEDEDGEKVDFDFHQCGYNRLYSNMSFCNSQAETNEVINQLRFKFDSNWSAVNFGEKIISSYMNFCTSKHEFQPAFWHIVNHNLRQDLLLRTIHGNILIFFQEEMFEFLDKRGFIQKNARPSYIQDAERKSLQCLHAGLHLHH